MLEAKFLFCIVTKIISILKNQKQVKEHDHINLQYTNKVFSIFTRYRPHFIYMKRAQNGRRPLPFSLISILVDFMHLNHIPCALLYQFNV